MTGHDDLEPGLLSVYQAEVLELLDSLGAIFEQLRNANPQERTEFLRAASRIAHTIKGSSRITGFITVVDLAHAMEDELKLFNASGSDEQFDRIPILFEAIRVIGEVVAGKCEADAASALAAQLRNTRAKAGETEAEGPASLSAPRLDIGAADGDNLKSQPEEPSRAPAEAAALASKSARIDLARLDRLMDAVRELVLSHQLVSGIDREIAALVEGSLETPSQPMEKHLDAAKEIPVPKALAQLLMRRQSRMEPLLILADKVLGSAQKLRMIPLHSLMSQWRRTVGEAAHALNKYIELQTDIGELELDRHVLDHIKDPILHLLRNAVDHGIEPQSERIKKGKQHSGLVHIRARLSGTTAIIEVSDDGRGIDFEGIRIQAVRQGLLEAEQAAVMSAGELCSCLFHPGFSTASRVSTLSGRGVGLDVVREAVRELGGHVEVRHPPILGGATFRIEVPVDVTLVRGLLVSSGNNMFVLPVEHIEGVLRVEADQLHWISDVCYAKSVSGQSIRIEPLWPSLPIPKARGRFLTIVWMSHGHRSVGLWVNELLEERFFLTHAPPWNLRRVTGLGSFAVLDDGKPACVVDISSLFDRKSWRLSAEPTRSHETPRILVVDDSLSVRTLVRTTLQSAGYEVVVKADGREAWQALSEMTFSLLVSDVRMPVMDGLELVRRIRSNETLKNLPIILLTSLDRPEDISAGAQSGANEYIVKGRFDQSRLLEAVARFV